MWGLLGKLFGSDKVIDKVASGIDKSIFTREEKADYLLKFLKAYEPFRISQRALAIMFSGTFLLGVLLSFFVFLFGAIVKDAVLINFGKQGISVMYDALHLPVSLILGFYFAGGTINTFMKRYDSKKEEVIK